MGPIGYISDISENKDYILVCHYLFNAPLSDYVMIVLLLGGSKVSIHNSYYVIEFMLSVTFELLVDTNPTCQSQLRLLPDIQLVSVTVFWWTSGGSYNWSIDGYTYNVSISSDQCHWIHWIQGLHKLLFSFINVANHIFLCI